MFVQPVVSLMIISSKVTGKDIAVITLLVAVIAITGIALAIISKKQDRRDIDKK